MWTWDANTLSVSAFPGLFEDNWNTPLEGRISSRRKSLDSNLRCGRRAAEKIYCACGTPMSMHPSLGRPGGQLHTLKLEQS